MSLVLDSNLLVKLVTAEVDSKEARSFITDFLKRGISMYSVDIALAESLNAIWKHVRVHRDLKVENAKSTLERI